MTLPSDASLPGPQGSEVCLALLDAIPEAIFLQDAHGRFIWVNEGVSRIFGHPRAHFLGQTPENLAAPEGNDLAAGREAFQGALRGEARNTRFWGQRADGGAFPLEVRLYPARFAGDAVVIAMARDLTSQSRADQIREAVYLISEAALATRDLQELYASVHATLRTLLPAENCYVALQDEATGVLHWPYWVDQQDPPPVPRVQGRGLTEFVLRTGLPALLDETILPALVASGEAAPIGTTSLAWMGVPLRNDQRVFGVLAIQSYEGGHRYRPEDLEILTFVSSQVAMAIGRKTREAQLQLVQAAVDGARDALYWVNEAGRFVFVNQTASRQLGYSSTDLSAMGVADIDPRMTPERWCQTWAEVKAGDPRPVETQHRRKDGSTFPVEITRAMICAGDRDLLFASVRDTTDRKAAEAALRLSEEKFSRAFQASPDAININRLDGTYLEVNEAFTRMSGWTREETLGRTTLDLGLWDNPEDRRRMQDQLQAQGRFAGLEARFRMKDGSLRTGLVSGVLIQVEGETCLLSITRDISERKAAEAALRISEDKFSRAFHASPDAINLTRLDDGTYLDVSQGFERLSGWTREEAVGHSAMDLGIWADPADRQRAVELVQKQGEFTGLEARFRRKDGTFLTGLMSGKSMDVDGIPCLLSVTRDISERKRSETALRQAEHRFRTVLTHSQAVIYQLDPEGTFLLSEGLGLANLRLEPGQVVGQSALELYRDDPETLGQLREGLAGRGSRRITHASGRVFDNFLTPVFDELGRVESLIGIATDVTEREEMEAALRAERGLFVGGPVMVFKWRSEPGWPVEYASPNVASILGYPVEELLSGRVPFSSLIHPEDHSRIHQETSGHETGSRYHYEQQYRLRTASGDYRWFYDFTAAAAPGPRPSHFLGYLLDITDRKQSEEALRQAQKLESLGILAGGIAHDFNNLLTVMLGNLNLAQLHLPESSGAGPYLATLEATVLRATELTKQMLAYSGRGHFQVKPQDLNTVVREVTRLLEVSVSKKIRLRLDLEADLPAIRGDAAQIQQVVMNLVTNASDAIGDREGAIHLSTASVILEAHQLGTVFRGENLAPGPYVLLEVADTGCGMDPAIQARIFDPFFTTKASGRGLGLSAMLGILRGHGAGLHLTSEPGKGSTFRLCFPATDAALPAAAAAPTGCVQTALHGRVLLVDDEDLVLQALRAALEVCGLEVTTARDGVEALACFQDPASRPDLVLMDVTMPRMDGREAFRAMHALDASVPVVLSSGYTEQDSMKAQSELAPAGFLQKPYQLDALRSLLQDLLGR